MEAEVCNTEVMFHGDIARSLKPMESVVSFSMEEICLELAQHDSYRTACSIANRLLHREAKDKLTHTTLKYRAVSEGEAIAAAYEDAARGILETHGIDPESGLLSEESTIPDTVKNPSVPASHDMESARDMIAQYNEGRKEREQISDAGLVEKVERNSERCCYISVDDIGVKHQKDSRKNGIKKNGKYVENTVIHIQYGELKYTITTVGMRKAFILLVAFLLSNGLMENNRLIFLSDGATCIRDCINEYFGFREYTLILDWLHLKKKCKEFMSMAVKAEDKEGKNEIIKDVLHILWAGNTEKAISYLNNLKRKNIKNQTKLNDMIDYLGRKKPYIHCYALRKQTGLRTSSNTVEKANDVNVAQRQKHNGMSWSKAGSHALATISVARHNHELELWTRMHRISFKMVS